jgi:hypothetical protein
MNGINVKVDGLMYPVQQRYEEWPRDEYIEYNVKMSILPDGLKFDLELFVNTYSKIFFYIENVDNQEGVMVETEKIPPYELACDFFVDMVDLQNSNVYYTFAILRDDIWCDVVTNEKIVED